MEGGLARLARKPGKRDLALSSYSYSKIIPCVYMDKQAGAVADILLKRGEISLTGMKISPYV